MLHLSSYVPVLHKPVVLAPVSAIANSQDAMVQLSLGARRLIVHTTGVQLQNGEEI